MAASIVAAETVPESLLPLDPEESVFVLFPVDLSSIPNQLAGDTQKVRIQVACKEWRLADDRYFIQALSDEAISENTFTLAVQRGISGPDK